MKDPNEKMKEEQNQVDPPEEPTESEESNWEKKQQIDEEGNELDPEDIK